MLRVGLDADTAKVETVHVEADAHSGFARDCSICVRLAGKDELLHLASVEVKSALGVKLLFGGRRKVSTIAPVLALAGGAAFAASWLVGQVTGGAGGNAAAAAVWERATLEVTEGTSLL